jgi:hypothetical protein
MGGLSIAHWLGLIVMGTLLYYLIAFIRRSRRRRKLFTRAERGAYGETAPEKPTPNSGRQTAGEADS